MFVSRTPIYCNRPAWAAWPWPMLSPRHVEPAFADQVLAAIPGVLERKRVAVDRYPKRRWMEACGKLKES